MSKESHLFELVHSLSKSEKRYIRLYAGLHEIGEKNNYIKLFDFIEKTKEVDDEKIQKAFKKEVFIKQLHVTKNYLHRMVLKALRNFNSESSVETEIRNHFHDAEILFSKSLITDCKRSLKKNEKLAQENDNFLVLSEVYAWYARINSGFDALGLAEQEEVWEKQVLYAKKLSNYLTYRHATLEFYHYLRAAGTSQPASTRKKLEEIISRPVFNDENAADSFSAKFNLYQVQVAWQFHVNNTKGAVGIQEKIIWLFEKNPEFIRNKPELFLTSLYNLGLILLTLFRWKDSGEIVLKIKSLTEKYKIKNSPAWEARVLTYGLDLELELCLMTGETEKGLRLFKLHEEILEKSEKHIEPLFKVQFQFKKTNLYFLQGNFKRAAALVSNQIAGYPKTIRQDLLLTLKLLQQMIFYEMGKYDLVAYGARNLKRQMISAGIAQSEEKIVAGYLEKLIRDPDNKKMKNELFQDMLSDLNYYISSSASFISLKFNYQAWALRHLG